MSELDDVRASANRWAYKYTLLAMWVRANLPAEQVIQARQYVAAGEQQTLPVDG